MTLCMLQMKSAIYGHSIVRDKINNEHFKDETYSI